jgi:dTDP-4-amino-4,6-dideoxygalactose transaminase
MTKSDRRPDGSVREGQPWSVDTPVCDEYLVFGSPQILEPEIEEVIATLRSGWIGTGPKVAQFEELFREYSGASYAVAVNSCTAALHLSLLAVGLKPGDEVIVPSMTFAATANAVIHAGGKPIFADVDRRTMCLDAADAEQRITGRTRAILPVHFAGRPADLQALLSLAKQRNLVLIEDCAHAIETLYQGRHVGTFGDLGCFSFYATKNLVTGEGGMVTTSNGSWASQIKTSALHGLSEDAWKRFSDDGFKHYEITQPGFKYNMTDLNASLGLHQLPRVEKNLIRRREIWESYDAAFSNLPVFLPAREDEGTRHARHLYTLLLDLERLTVGRDEIQVALHRQNIGTGIHYTALHLHAYYRKTFGTRRGDLPNTEWIADRTLSLPLSPKLSDRNVADVIFAVCNTLRHFAR